MAGFDRHHIQNPIFSSKAKVKSVQDQNQRSFGKRKVPRPRCELSQISTKAPTQPLRGKAIALSESFQCACVYKYRLESSRRAFGDACGLVVSCGFSTCVCIDCTDNVENRSDKFSLCNIEISRATNATFIIDPDGVVKAMDVHDNSIGRSAEEILRKLAGRQLRALAPGRSLPGQLEAGEENPEASIGFSWKDLTRKESPRPGVKS